MDSSLVVTERDESDIEIISTATYDRRFVDDQGEFVFRYNLTREWRTGGVGKLVFLMLNGSTATATKNDPTVKRCMVWTRLWGYKVLEVVNLFAFRSVDPKKMKAAEDPVGPLNDEAILEACKDASLVVCAWGTHGTFRGRGRYVRKTLLAGRDLHFMKKTKDGIPGHPLYLLGDLKPTLWRN